MEININKKKISAVLLYTLFYYTVILIVGSMLFNLNFENMSHIIVFNLYLFFINYIYFLGFKIVINNKTIFQRFVK